MGLLDNLVDQFTHSGGHGQQQNQSSGYGQDNYNQQGGYGGNSASGGAPQVPPPWRAVWDDRENRWLFINESNGERTFQHPGQNGGYGGGYGSGYNQGPPQGQYGGGYNQGYSEEPRQENKSHGLAYGAMGAAAGLAGGAVLMHEGEEVKQDWDEDKYKAEAGFDRFGERIEDAPEDAARWTGSKVGEVEDIPQDIENDYDQAKYGVENKWDNAVQDVEDVPEDVAGFAGEGVGRVERFGDDADQYGDNLDSAYDQGRDEERNDDSDRW